MTDGRHRPFEQISPSPAGRDGDKAGVRGRFDSQDVTTGMSKPPEVEPINDGQGVGDGQVNQYREEVAALLPELPCDVHPARLIAPQPVGHLPYKLKPE
ncbi:hypothetical protein [Jeongeupia sp. HS-3]|uniref:hypothetical protein n=1 Tax=Jeongeupia sp. HS-3 TaxID=1009682 RepID=UPI001910062D|nr:hypothetical protein [Jeongeupia sp. HS-3]